ncbi:MAG TPA: hypothetical protein EYO95_03420, partial [Methylophaga sp.]|nr:hypothetical protein [Methylophaga sp.]
MKITWAIWTLKWLVLKKVLVDNPAQSRLFDEGEPHALPAEKTAVQVTTPKTTPTTTVATATA